MKSSAITCVIIVVLLDIQDKWMTGAQVPEKSCKSTVQDLTKMQLALLGQCGKSMKFKNGKEKAKKQNCVLRCAMIKAELIGNDGQVTLESVNLLLNKFMPPSLIEHANKTFFPCMQLGIDEPFKSLEEDEFCNTYDPFIKCFMGKVGNFCT